MFGAAFSLRLLVGGGLGGGLSGGFLLLLLLLTLYFGVFSSIPGIKNLATLSVAFRDGGATRRAATYIAVIFLVVELTTADGSDRRRRRGSARLARLVVCSSKERSANCRQVRDLTARVGQGSRRDPTEAHLGRRVPRTRSVGHLK